MTVSEVAAYLRAHDKYLILTHRRPDGDTLGCAAALCAMLRQMGKTAGILYNRETTEHFESYVEQYWVADDFDYETVVSVDLAALSLFPDNAEMFKTRVDLAIDHHPSYEGFGKESCVHPECAACGEILCELAQELGQLTPEVALPLYVAVSTDTGCFVYSNVTANTHRVAAALMETGIDYKAANKLHFRTKSKKRLALEGELLRTMEFYDEDRVVIVAVNLHAVVHFRIQQQAGELLVQIGQFFFGGHNFKLFFFRLLDFNIFLQPHNQRLLQFFNADGLIGNLAQGDNRVFVIVAGNRNRRTGTDVFGSLSRNHQQFIAIRNFINAVFNSNTCHFLYTF